MGFTPYSYQTQTLLQYTQHPNFYFTIQHIKIIYLHNKIIKPNIQIKPKTQNPIKYYLKKKYHLAGFRSTTRNNAQFLLVDGIK